MTALDRIPTFAEPDIFHVVVESPRGSAIKLKYRADLDAMSISRPLVTGLVYPYDWGFVPSTRGEDGDPVDAALFWDVATFPGVVVPSRALAVIQVEQNRADGKGRARNDRILAVPIHARREAELTSALSLPKRIRDELEQFFMAATVLEGKDPKILNWAGPDAALALLQSRATSDVAGSYASAPFSATTRSKT
jgi:inorganic pyrophosphatase